MNAVVSMPPVSSPSSSSPWNAIVFCNLPDDLTSELCCRLADFGVTVVRSYKPDIGMRLSKLESDVQLVVAIISLMSHGQTEKIRLKAKQWKLPCALLRHNNISSWGAVLAPLRPKVVIGAVPLPPSPSVPTVEVEPLSASVKTAMATYMSLTETHVSEDEILEAIQAVWDPAFDNLGQVEERFERYCKIDRAPVEFRAWWDARKKSLLAPMPAPLTRRPQDIIVLPAVDATVASPPSLEQEIAALRRQLHETQEMERLYEEDNKRLERERVSLQASVQTLSKDNASLRRTRLPSMSASLKEACVDVTEIVSAPELAALRAALEDERVKHTALRATLEDEQTGHAATRAALDSATEQLREFRSGHEVWRAGSTAAKAWASERARLEDAARVASQAEAARSAELRSALAALSKEREVLRLKTVECDRLVAEKATLQTAAKHFDTDKAALQKKLRQAEEKVAVATTGSLDQIGASLKNLHDAKILSRDEIGGKLVRHLLGEK